MSPENKIKCESLIMRDKMEDQYFAHQMTGDIFLAMEVVGKLTISQFQLQKRDPESIQLDSIRSTMSAKYPFNSTEIQFIIDCAKSVLSNKSGVKNKMEMYDSEGYGNNFSLTEIEELIEERAQRKFVLNQKLFKLMHPKKIPVTGG
jgi:hypothetical protein